MILGKTFDNVWPQSNVGHDNSAPKYTPGAPSAKQNCNAKTQKKYQAEPLKADFVIFCGQSLISVWKPEGSVKHVKKKGITFGRIRSGYHLGTNVEKGIWLRRT